MPTGHDYSIRWGPQGVWAQGMCSCGWESEYDSRHLRESATALRGRVLADIADHLLDVSAESPGQAAPA